MSSNPESGQPAYGEPHFGEQAGGSNPYGQQPAYGAPYGQQQGTGDVGQGSYGQGSYGQGGYGPGGYPTGGYPPVGYGQPAYPTQQRTNVLAIIALVLGFVIPLGGVICGFIAKRQIRRTGENGNGLATAGIIVGFVLIALSVLFFAIVVAGVSSHSGNATGLVPLLR